MSKPVLAARMPSLSRYLYVGTYTDPPSTSVGIYVFTVDSEGSLTLLQEVGGIRNPSWLTLAPSGRFLYAINEVADWAGSPCGAATGFAIDSTGTLTRIGEQACGGTGPAGCAVSPSGRYLLVNNYRGGSFGVLPLGPDGELGEVTDVFTATGSGPNPDRQREPHPHDVTFDPFGSFVFGCDLGTDKVWIWRLDEGTGRLVPTDPGYAQVASGSGPRHLVFHPSGRFVYVINELTSSITAFRYDASRAALTWTQTVSTLPPGFAGENTTAEIVAHPNGRFLYGSNRGDDSLAVFGIDQGTGHLDPIGWVSSRGATPRNFALDPSGELLLAANQDSDSIVAFRIDPATGQPDPTGRVATAPRPVCLVFGRPMSRTRP